MDNIEDKEERKMNNNTNTLQIVPSQIEIHSFSDMVMDVPIYFQIVFLKESYCIWIGNAPPRLDNLAFAMPTPFVRSMIGTQIQTHSYA